MHGNTVVPVMVLLLLMGAEQVVAEEGGLGLD